MDKVQVKYNDECDELYCIFCKERINLGEKYVEVIEEELGEEIIKIYHPDCLPVEEEDLVIDETEE